ncbi:hypothetical protein EV426DRAFT_617784 [Tirmania nivea]|nr:hypothetical protein EV426DRAFT_617784 [Tirmania nivea]
MCIAGAAFGRSGCRCLACAVIAVRLALQSAWHCSQVGIAASLALRSGCYCDQVGLPFTLLYVQPPTRPSKHYITLCCQCHCLSSIYLLYLWTGSF